MSSYHNDVDSGELDKLNKIISGTKTKDLVDINTQLKINKIQ